MAEPKLRVNAAFAERYGRYRRREELQRRETPGTGPGTGLGTGEKRGEPGGTGGGRSCSAGRHREPGREPGIGAALDPREEREFYRTLALLKTRDPRIYRADTAFYSRGGTGGASIPGGLRNPRPMFLKDYERKVVLEKEG
ncbi:KRI1 protein, partial [Pomatostomus ruficeps]|nr:KRI1 protein [Pomatostomus ruficeps]